MFNTGGLTLTLTLFWAIIGGWFIYQTINAAKSGGQRYDINQKKIVFDDLRTPFIKIPQFWLFLVLTVFYIVAMYAVYIDYR